METTEAPCVKPTDKPVNEHAPVFAGAGDGGSSNVGLRRRYIGLKNIQITIKILTGRTFTLDLDLSETILTLKEMIEEKEGIPPWHQGLVASGRRLNNIDRTLADYSIENGSTIYLIPRLRGGGDNRIVIFVSKATGETLELELTDKTTILEIKDMIFEKEGIDQRQQDLVFEGGPLNDSRTLLDYNINNDTTLYLAPFPRGGDSPPDEAGGTCIVAVDEAQMTLVGDEGSSEHMGPSGEMEVRPIQVGINRLTLKDVHGICTLTDQLEQKQKRWHKYSLKVLVFGITMFATYMGSASTSSPAGNMIFKISIGSFFIADAALSLLTPPEWGNALVYVSSFLLVLVSYLLLVSFNMYYAYAILFVPLTVIAALLQVILQAGATNDEANQNVNIDRVDQDHDTEEEDNQNFDRIFELSSDIVNCGGIITVVFGNSMVGPASAIGFLFFYTIALGLYLMMVTTVRTAALTPHARCLAILLKVLLVTTLITSLIHGVRASND